MTVTVWLNNDSNEADVKQIQHFTVTDYLYLKDETHYIVQSDGKQFDLYTSETLNIGTVCTGIFNVFNPDEERNFIKRNEKLKFKIKNLNGRLYEGNLNHCSHPDNQFSIKELRNNYIKNVLATGHEFQYDIITLSIGNNAFISNDFFDALQKLGIYHLYVISGTHIAFLSGVLFYILKQLKIPIEIVKVILIILLLLYLTFNFFSPSVVRAVLMANALLITSFFNKKPYITIVSLSAIVQILIHPYITYHVGFQLSYLTTYTLLLTKQFIENFSVIKQIIMLSLICEICTVVIILIHFNELSISGIVMNTIFAPLFSLLIFPLVMIYNFAMIFNVTDLINDIYNFVFMYLHELILYISNLMTHRVNIKNLNHWIYIVLIVISYKSIVYICTRQYLKFLHSVFIFILITFVSSHYETAHFKITMVDVGQGDSFVIQDLKNHHTVLIDTGGKFQLGTTPIPYSEKNLVPYLKEQGINVIDAIVVTHFDIDHMGELSNIIQSFRINHIIINKNDFGISIDETMMKDINIQLIDIHQIDFFNIGDIQFKKVLPNEWKYYDDKNEHSIVLNVLFDDFKFLFTGDATIQNEEVMIKNDLVGDIDVLKVAHHGSETSSSQAFIEYIKPEISLISAGVNNHFGHPHQKVLNQLAGTIQLNTIEDGMVELYIKNNRLCYQTKLSDRHQCIKKEPS